MIVACFTHANEVTEKATYRQGSAGNTETIKQTGFYWHDPGEKPIMS